MMIDFNKAKEKYNSIEIPQELDEIVENSIKQFEQKQRRTKIHFLRLAPVAVCAVICLAIGISTLPKNRTNEGLITADSTDAGVPELARSVPAAGAGNGISEDRTPAAMNAETESTGEYKANSKMSMYNMYVAEKIDESIEKAVKAEVSDDAYSEVVELYSDENVYSYCVTTFPSNTANYYNVKQSDGAEIELHDLLKNAEGLENCEFYFKSANCLAVICDGEEKEIIID
ncbi:MAG: hypothetical protein E7441_12320 [Ruminococcaceae bacterium]|nr:hypothetical protein [Oscillospiraceae bacterium]